MYVQTIQVIEEANAIKTSSANVQPIRETIWGDVLGVKCTRLDRFAYRCIVALALFNLADSTMPLTITYLISSA